METIIKRLFFVFVALVVVFAFNHSALALVGSQAGADGTGGITVYPNAPGTKYEGPLTIYYVPADGGLFDMYFFMRLRKGSTLLAFSGFATGVSYTDVPEQQDQIESFFATTVMPILYPDTPTPSFLLKSVDQKVEDNPLVGGNNGMLFAIMDVVIAVQD